jgi:hypothetical protein
MFYLTLSRLTIAIALMQYNIDTCTVNKVSDKKLLHPSQNNGHNLTMCTIHIIYFDILFDFLNEYFQNINFNNF